jgi:hypothetical protein
MTGIRVQINRPGQGQVFEELEHLTSEELAAGLRPGGFLVGSLVQHFIRLVEWVKDLSSNLPYILSHMTPGEISSFAHEHGRAWSAWEMMHSIALFRGGPLDEHRREFDQEGRLHVFAGGWDHVYERAEHIGQPSGQRVVWQYNDQLSHEEL